MVSAHPPPPPSDPDPSSPRPAGGRFNILLTEDRVRPIEHWTRQFPRLMQPLGVEAHLATTGQQALELTERIAFHAAFIDLATPKDDASAPATAPGGLWLLKVLQRKAQRPPVVVVNSRATRQQAVRLLNDALRLGAFSVVNQPVELNHLLAVAQRLLARHHRGQWPAPGSSNNSTPST
ncbi:MAG: response regulator [Planctomycetota bacterium]